MYPELTRPLLVLLGAALAVVVFLAIGRPVLRRLAARQIRRRPAEAVLVVIGSLLGTSLIVASLVVGDSLDRSVRQTAYDVLGPVDEVVRIADADQGREASARMQPLASDPRVDGLLTVRNAVAPASARVAGNRVTSPRTYVWELDFDAASQFGSPDASGLAAPDPGPDGVVVNQPLADQLGLSVGEPLTLHLYGSPETFTVAGVVPAEGLAGMGLGAAVNRNVFVTPGVVTTAAEAVQESPLTSVLVSNRGGVESGAAITDEVTALIRKHLAGMDEAGAAVTEPKQEVLDLAEQTSATLGSLFLFIASFAIIAGVLLVVNIFVMLAEERKGQLGVLRAIGMRRRRVVGEFALEGAFYAAAAALVGAAVGILVGRVVVVLALSVLNSYERSDNSLDVVFDVTATSVVNGVAGGFLIGLLAVVVTSARIARINIIAAIRDLPAVSVRRPRRGLTALSVAGTLLFTALSVPALASSAGAAVYLTPVLALVSAIPLMRRVMRPGTATTIVAVLTLAWGLGAHVVRPHMFDDTSTATYVVMGTMLSFAAVVLLSKHQKALLLPLRPLIARPTQTGLAARLAVAYPQARAFRTGATLAMYCIVVMVIVLLAQISAVIQAGVDVAVKDATAGWTLRADFNPAAPLPDSTRSLTSGSRAGMVDEIAPLLTAAGSGSDPLGRTDQPVPLTAVGIPGQLVANPLALEDRLDGLRTDRAVWRLVLRDPAYALIDVYYGATGGPQGVLIEAGDRIEVTDPSTGAVSERIVAGTLRDGSAFNNIGTGENRWPVVMSTVSVRDAFGAEAGVNSLLVRTAPGVDDAAYARGLQSEFLANGMVVTDIPQDVRRTYAANTQMFRLMQGYLALGLLVAIIGLGVVMVRSVRERRRTIGVLRAIGFRASTVRRSFLAESTVVAVEGVVVGVALGILTTYLLYSNSPMFGSVKSSFPVAWLEIGLTVGVALVASLLATVIPARRAAAVRPAVAVRVAD